MENNVDSLLCPNPVGDNAVDKQVSNDQKSVLSHLRWLFGVFLFFIKLFYESFNLAHCEPKFFSYHSMRVSVLFHF